MLFPLALVGFAPAASAQCYETSNDGAYCIVTATVALDTSASGDESRNLFSSSDTPDPFQDVPAGHSVGADLAPAFRGSSFTFDEPPHPRRGQVASIASQLGRTFAAGHDATANAQSSEDNADASGAGQGDVGVGEVNTRVHAADGRPLGDGSVLRLPDGAAVMADDAGPDPVDPANGEFRDAWTDLHIAGVGLDLDLVRTYRSRSLARGPLGVGWNLSFHERIVADDGCAAPAFLWQTLGSTVRFVESTAGRYEATTAERLLLTRDGDGFVVTLANGVEHRFDDDGLLSSVVDRNGNTITVEWLPRADGMMVVSRLIDTVGRPFLFSWTSAGDLRTLEVTGPADVLVRYEVLAQGDLQGVPASASHLAKNDDLVAVQDVHGRRYSFIYDHRSATFDPHIATNVVEDSCARSCGLDPSACQEDPCVDVAIVASTACEQGCETSCTGECGAACASACDDDCSSLCPLQDCDACDDDIVARDICDSPELRAHCGNSCLDLAEDTCNACEDEFMFTLSTSGISLDLIVSAFKMLIGSVCEERCLECMLGGDNCPDDMDCMASGPGCPTDCLDVALDGSEVLGDECGGDGSDTDPDNGCVGEFKASCHNECQASINLCQSDCGNTCGDSCNDNCAWPCTARCEAACPSIETLHAMCQDSCMGGCIAGAFDPGHDPENWGAHHELNHNLLEVRLDDVIILANEYGADRFLPAFDRVVRQEFGPAAMTFGYAGDPALPGGELELCPLSERVCSPAFPLPGSDLIERWIGALDNLIVVVELNAGFQHNLRPEWEVQGTIPLPVIELTRTGNTVTISPTVDVGRLRIVDGQGAAIELLPTNVPGYLVSRTSLSSLPAVMTVVQSPQGASGHPGRLLGLVRLIDGTLPRSMVHFERSGGVTRVLPADATVGSWQVRELSRRWKSAAGSAVASPIGDVRVHLGDVVTTESLAGVASAWPAWSQTVRATLSPFTAAQGGGSTLAGVTTALNNARLATTPAILAAESAATSLSANTRFTSDLVAQATLQQKRDSAQFEVLKVLATPAADAKLLSASLTGGNRSMAITIEAAIDSASRERSLVQYRATVDAALALVSAFQPLLSGTPATRLSKIKQGLSAARSSAPTTAALAAVDDVVMKLNRVLADLEAVQATSATALASFEAWRPLSARQQAVAADALLRSRDVRDAPSWAVNALKDTAKAWSDVRLKLPKVDVTGFLLEGGGAASTWAFPLLTTWWVDQLLGAIREDLLVGDICTGGDTYLDGPRPRAGSQRSRQLTVVNDAEGDAWSYYADGGGQVVRAISPEGNTRDWNYDTRGRLIGARSEFGDRHCYKHDGDGNVRTDTWFPAPGRPAPQPFRSTTFIWEPSQRLHEIHMPAAATGIASAAPTTTLDWDERGNLERMVAADGETIISVDERGRPQEIFGPAGDVALLEHDAPTPQSRSTTIVGPAGVAREESITADALGRTQRIDRTGEPSIEIDWVDDRPSEARRLATSDTTDVSRRFTYNNSGDLVEIQDINSADSIELLTVQAFDRRGLLVRRDEIASGQQRTSCFGYDGRHDLIETVSPSGRRVAFERAPSGDVTAITRGTWPAAAGTDPACPVFPGPTVTETLVTRDRTVPGFPSSQRAQGNVINYTYNGFGETIQETDARGTSEHKFVDGRGRVNRVARRTAPAVDLLAVPTLTDLQIVALTEVEHDDVDRVRLVRQAWFEDDGARTLHNGGWSTTSMAFDDAAGSVTTTLPGARVERRWFDPVVGTYVVERPDDSVVTRQTSADLRVVTTTVPSPSGTGTLTTVSELSSLGQPLREFDGGGRRVSDRTYDEYGRLLYENSPTISHSFEYNGFGELEASYQHSIDDTRTPVSRIQYDADGNPTVLVDDEATKVTRDFDAVGRPIKTIWTDGTSESFIYTSGTLLPIQRLTRDGHTIDYQYDGAGSLARLSKGSTTLRNFVWDATGLVRAVANDRFGVVDATFRRDSLGRVVEEGSNLFADDVQRSFGVAGNVAFLHAGGHAIMARADALGRPFDIRVDGQSVAMLAFEEPGAAPTVRRANQLVETSLHDGGGALTGFEDVDASSTTRRRLVARVLPSRQIDRLDATYAGVTTTSLFQIDGKGAVSAEAHGFQNLSSTATFQSTPLSQAKTFAVRTYDDRDNWTTVKRDDQAGITIAVGRDDRLSQFMGPVDADGAGRVTRLTGVDGRKLVFEWDALGEMTSMSNGATKLYPRVDGLGRLVELRDGSARVRAFQYDGDRIVVEHLKTAQRLIVPGPGAVPLAIIQGQTTWYVHRGWNDRIAALSDSAGNIIARYETSAFGEVTAASPSGVPWVDPYELDLVVGGQPAVFGLQRLGARWHGPEWGRFMSPDPSGFADGINVYAYVGNRPLLFTDPSGRGRFDPQNLPSPMDVAEDAYVAGTTLALGLTAMFHGTVHGVMNPGRTVNEMIQSFIETGEGIYAGVDALGAERYASQQWDRVLAATGDTAAIAGVTALIIATVAPGPDVLAAMPGKVVVNHRPQKLGVFHVSVKISDVELHMTNSKGTGVFEPVASTRAPAGSAVFEVADINAAVRKAQELLDEAPFPFDMTNNSCATCVVDILNAGRAGKPLSSTVKTVDVTAIGPPPSKLSRAGQYLRDLFDAD
ncbi:MAG: DUF6531 domain-containing protein [Deltaproteobacteria bacterium]|nr:DUF6531 domain-containing protein [Deltaproteobacteria bacterium]